MKGPDLKRIRHDLGLSQEALGRQLGYTGPHVRMQMSRFERGERPLPASLVLRMIELGWYQPTRRAAG